MREIKPGGIRQGLEALQYFFHYLPVNANVATDGDQSSAVVTVGTVATEIWNALVNPGFQMDNLWINTLIRTKFVGLNGSFVASMNFYLRGRTEWVDEKGVKGTLQQGAWATLSGLIVTNPGTLATNDNVAVSGKLDPAVINKTPFRLSVMAYGQKAAVCTGQVKGDSYIEMVGAVIPGA